MTAPTREQLLAAAHDFEGFTSSMIKMERRFRGLIYFLVYWQIAVVVWQFPVASWWEVFVVFLNLAGAVYGFHCIGRSNRLIADMTEARALAVCTIAELEAQDPAGTHANAL